MNVCVVFNSKYSKPKASAFQTMSGDAQRAAKRFVDLVVELRGQTELHPPPKSLKKFNPKMHAFKRVFELTCG